MLLYVINLFPVALLRIYCNIIFKMSNLIEILVKLPFIGPSGIMILNIVLRHKMIVIGSSNVNS